LCVCSPQNVASTRDTDNEAIGKVVTLSDASN
jgi:hypothetical protein